MCPIRMLFQECIQLNLFSGPEEYIMRKKITTLIKWGRPSKGQQLPLMATQAVKLSPQRPPLVFGHRWLLLLPLTMEMEILPLPATLMERTPLLILETGPNHNGYIAK